MSTTAVVISTGAVLGKANPVQLIVMTLVELIFFYVSRCINRTLLEVPWWDLQICGGKCHWSFGTAQSGAAAKALCGLDQPTDGEYSVGTGPRAPHRDARAPLWSLLWSGTHLPLP